MNNIAKSVEVHVSTVNGVFAGKTKTARVGNECARRVLYATGNRG
jgi:hypothetical protein